MSGCAVTNEKAAEKATHETTGDGVDRWLDLLHTLLGVPATGGNEIEVLRNGVEIFPAMLAAIDEAAETVDLVTFVYWTGSIADRFATSLAAAAQRGCRVRVLLDAIGARKIDHRLIERMSEAGCDVRSFRPVVDGPVPKPSEANHRTHRKVLVCDGRIAFCGGVGIAEEWTGDARNPSEWRDTHLAIRGPAVAGLHAAFLDNWADTRIDAFDPLREPPIGDRRPGSANCIVIRGSAQTGSTDLWRLGIALIASAEERIDIASAYFNPDERMTDELVAAAARGVRVRVLVPGEHADKLFVQLAGQAVYERLLAGGVEIYEFGPSMMHAKIITVDGVVATVGSANFNQRSMRHDDETNVVIVEPDVVAVLEDQFDHDLNRSDRFDPARWCDRGVVQRLSERMSALFDRWL